jgi:hypothetical protein
VDGVGVSAETTKGHDEQWFKDLAVRMTELLKN